MKQARQEWMRMPTRRALAWTQISPYARAMGTELYRVHCAESCEIRVPADWKTALARSLELSGRDRPPFLVALEAMVEAGVLIVGQGVVYLLYTDAELAAHGGGRLEQLTPESDPPHTGGTPAAQRQQNGTTPEAHRGRNGSTSTPQPPHIDRTPTSQVAASARNDSDRISQIDREKERKIDRSRVRAAVRAREAPTLEALVSAEQPRLSPCSAARDLLAEATSGPGWPVDRWHAELLKLARKPLAELAQVLDAVELNAWLREDPMRCSPSFVLDRWAHFAAARAKPPRRAEPPPALPAIEQCSQCPPELAEQVRNHSRRRTG
jgi:hypothetical protein